MKLYYKNVLTVTNAKISCFNVTTYNGITFTSSCMLKHKGESESNPVSHSFLFPCTHTTHICLKFDVTIMYTKRGATFTKILDS